MVKPWTKLGEGEVLASGYGKALRKVWFRDPKGKEVDFYLYDHDDWVVVFALTDDGKVVAIRQYYQGANDIILTLPGGGLDSKDETPKRAASRELGEETGYRCDGMVATGSCYLLTRNSGTQYYTFAGRGAVKVCDQQLDELEEIEVELIPLEQWVQMCQDGTIVDHCAVVATLRGMCFLKRRETE